MIESEMRKKIGELNAEVVAHLVLTFQSVLGTVTNILSVV